MGDTVNLAARFCDLAETNSICADQNFFFRIQGAITSFNLTPKTSQNNIKGYEGEQFNLVNAMPKRYKAACHHFCPNCNNVIETTSIVGEYEIRKCIVCDFGELSPVALLIDKPSQSENEDRRLFLQSMMEKFESPPNRKVH
jgi:hypothetical protein